MIRLQAIPKEPITQFINGRLFEPLRASERREERERIGKDQLNASYYIRYVDDFVILHRDKRMLEKWEHEIGLFLIEKLKIELYPEKTRIIPLRRGITFLGFRIFSKYRLLKKSNARRIWKRLDKFKTKYDNGEMTRKEVVRSLEGWLAYAEFADSYKFRKRVVATYKSTFDLWSIYRCDDKLEV